MDLDRELHSEKVARKYWESEWARVCESNEELRRQKKTLEKRAIQAAQRWKEEHEAHTKRIAQFNDEKSTRIQAEQERDEAQKEADRARRKIWDRELQHLEERNALLEGLKWYADESEEVARAFHFGLYPSSIGERARSIIAQLEPGGEFQ